MDFIEWKESLRVGIDVVDEQHQELFRRTNLLLEACKQRKGKEAIGELLNYLEGYTRLHFKQEEELQLQYGFDEYESHKKMHEGFIREISRLRKRLEGQGPTSSLVIEASQTLVEWLLRHVGVEDKKLHKFVVDRSIQ